MAQRFDNEIVSFSRFLDDFCFKVDDEEINSGELPIRIITCTLLPFEAEGECINWVFEYLKTRKCPFILACHIAKTTCDEILSSDYSQYYDDTEEREIRQIDANCFASAVLKQVNIVCRRWQTNMPSFTLPETVFTVSSHSIKNSRRKMEDRHVIFPDLNALFDLTGHPTQSYYAVFDGHAGVDAAVYSASHLAGNIVHDPTFQEDLPAAMKNGFKATDEKFVSKAQRESLRSGATGLAALIRGSSVCLAWLGDSQAVVVANGKTEIITSPHKPETKEERERIEDLGGCVILYGVWRVNGSIAVSRAIGDADYKPYICSDADTITFDLDGTEDYLVLACDGAWDTIMKEDLPNIVYNYLQTQDGCRETVAQHLVKVARDNGSSDNITVIVVFFTDKVTNPETSSENMVANGDEANCHPDVDGTEDSNPKSNTKPAYNQNPEQKSQIEQTSNNQGKTTGASNFTNAANSKSLLPDKKVAGTNLLANKVNRKTKKILKVNNPSAEPKKQYKRLVYDEVLWAFTGNSKAKVENYKLKYLQQNLLHKNIVDRSYSNASDEGLKLSVLNIQNSLILQAPNVTPDSSIIDVLQEVEISNQENNVAVSILKEEKINDLNSDRNGITKIVHFEDGSDDEIPVDYICEETTKPTSKNCLHLADNLEDAGTTSVLLKPSLTMYGSSGGIQFSGKNDIFQPTWKPRRNRRRCKPV